MRDKLIELLSEAQFESTDAYVFHRVNRSQQLEMEADHLIANGVTIQNHKGCDFCQEDSDGYRKMIGAFSITNPFHGKVWQIETAHCKPRQIFYCPMCGRKLSEQPKENRQ